jgi:nicotinamidase-related amidase
VQQGVVATGHNRDAVVANVATLVQQARQVQVPVIWVQHSDDELIHGSEAWQIVPELQPEASEVLVDKRYGDAFEETTLESVLAGQQVGRLFVSGAQTDWCIRSTLHGALTRGYDTVLVSDAHTTDDFSEHGAPTPDKVIAHTNMYWTYHAAPGRVAGTVQTAAVDFSA